MASRDHRVAQRQALQNLHLAWLTQAQFHSHPLGLQATGGFARHHFEHKAALALRHDGLFRNDQGVFTHTKDRIDAGKHARSQLLLAVVDAAAHPDRAAIGVDQGVDRLHNGRKAAVRQGIQGQLGFLACTYFGLVALGQTEIEQHRIDVFQVDHVRAVSEVVTHMDLLETGDPIKRRQHLQALQTGFAQRQLGAGHLERGSALVERTLADEVLRHQLLVALVVGLGNRQLGPHLRQLGLLQLVFKLHHQLALAHTLAIVEENLLDAPTHLGSQHHALP